MSPRKRPGKESGQRPAPGGLTFYTWKLPSLRYAGTHVPLSVSVLQSTQPAQPSAGGKDLQETQVCLQPEQRQDGQAQGRQLGNKSAWLGARSRQILPRTGKTSGGGGFCPGFGGRHVGQGRTVA